MTNDVRTLDTSYAAARRRFLEAAGRRGAAISTFSHPDDADWLAALIARFDDGASSALRALES